MGIILLIWLLLLPVGYLVLWKAAKSETNGGAGCLGELFNVPHSLAEARKRFLTINLILLACIAIAVVVYSAIALG